MHELSGFEQRLSVALDDYAGPRRPVDPMAIARRAATSGADRRVQPAVIWRRSKRTETRAVLRVALVAAVLAVALLAGGLLVGSWSERPAVRPSQQPSVAPATAPTQGAIASTFSCAQARAAAARTTATWTAGPAPESPSTAESGWVAIWGSAEVPELFLIDPTNGAACSIARFEDYASPPRTATQDGPRDWIPFRGPLVWSPDGHALAFIVVDTEPAEVRDLYVWSEAGLAGPLLSFHDDQFLPGRPSWSPDGSMLAVSDRLTTHVPTATNVWIISRTGEPARPIASGCICHLSPVTWSESGRRIVATTRNDVRADGIVAGSVDDAQLRPVPLADEEMAADFDDAPFGFVDDDTILVADTSAERFIGRGIDGGADRDIGPMGVTLDTIQRFRGDLAPDRSAWLFSGFRLLVVDVASGETRNVVTGLPEFFLSGWAPNSRGIGYVLDVQTTNQGVWIVNRDGSDGRRVVAGPFVLEFDAPSAFAWQPVWPAR